MDKVFKVKVKAGAKEDKIISQTDDLIKVSIREKPIEGKANQYLIKFLKKALNADVEILKGKSSSEKLVRIKNE